MIINPLYTVHAGSQELIADTDSLSLLPPKLELFKQQIVELDQQLHAEPLKLSEKEIKTFNGSIEQLEHAVVEDFLFFGLYREVRRIRKKFKEIKSRSMSAQPIQSLERLPGMLLAKIAEYLPPRKKGQDLYNYLESLPQKQKDLVLMREARTSIIDTIVQDADGDIQKIPSYIREILHKYGKNIPNLCLKNIPLSEEKLEGIFTLFPHLVYLCLESCHLTDACLRVIGEHCPDLKFLNISNNDLLRHLSVFTEQAVCVHLEYIILNCGQISSTEFRHLTMFSKMKILDIQCTKITSEDLAELLVAFPLLTNINLSGCQHITDQAILAASQHAKQLEWMTLDRCHITDKALEACATLSSLRGLSVESCHRITDAGVQQLVRLQALETLNLNMCQNVTVCSVEMLERLAFLKRLSIDGTPAERNLTFFPKSFSGRDVLDLSQIKQIDDFQKSASLGACTECTHLTMWRFEGDDEEMTKHMRAIEQLPKLKHLDLSYGDVRGINLSRLHTVSSLTLPSILDDEALSGCSKLRSLRSVTVSIDEYTDISEAGMLDLLKNPNLEELDIRCSQQEIEKYPVFFTPKVACAIFTHPRLQKVHLQDLASSNDAGWKDVIQYVHAMPGAPELKQVDLSGCKYTTPELFYLLGRLPNLQELHLARFEAFGFDDEHISNAMAYFTRHLHPTLRKVDFSACSELMDKHLQPFIWSAPFLEYLNLEMCRHLTALSAESIGTLCELTVLNINGAELDDVTPIFNCTKLQELYMDMDDDDDQEIFYIEDDDLQELPRLKNLKKLSLKNQIRLSDQALTYVRHLDNLTDLNMRGCSGYEEHHDQQGNHQQGNPGITDAGMEYICNLPHLRSLDVGDTNVTSTDAISRIVNLRELTLSGSPLTNESIQALKNCKYLELLDLNLCHMLSSAGMSHLQDMNTLMYLYLDETRVGAGVEGIEPLKRLSNLFTLTLNRCPIGDHICTALSKIQTLIVLELEETRISGDGLKELADLPFLQTIDIRSCFEVSEKKLKRFSMMRPDVDIVR